MDRFVIKTKREQPTKKTEPEKEKELKQTTILSLKVKVYTPIVLDNRK